MNQERAAKAMADGEPVVLYDGDDREGEADIVLHAAYVTPATIEKLRKEAGGLICLAMDDRKAKLLGIPFYTELLENRGGNLKQLCCRKTAYGDPPAFSISVNHKKVYTGITDNDRALTIRKMAEALNSENPKKTFLENFYSPGHVFLLIGRGLKKRRGHTELALELAKKAGMEGAVVLCEMLGKGSALSRKNAEKYATENGFVFVEGKNIR